MRLLVNFALLVATLPLIVPACGGGDDDGGNGGNRDGGGGQGGNAGAGSDGGSPDPVEAAIPCRSDKVCTPHDLLCDLNRSVCVECLATSDCGDDALCFAGKCVEVTSCKSSKECGSDQVCDTDLGYCVECIGDNDCEAEQICAGSVCRDTCQSSKECSSRDQVCGGEGYCVDCDGDNDCEVGSYCEEAVCVPGVCETDATSCNGDELLTCNARGSGFTAAVCADGCVEEDDVAMCEGEGPVGGCEGGTANPCSAIPRFTGTQVVDGDPEDFCDVPYRTLNLSNAAMVGGPTGDPIDRSTIESNSSAQIRVAWSESFLHVHVHVVDPVLKVVSTSGTEYNGDNVQLFIQGSAPVGGSRLPAGSTSGVASVDQAGRPQQIFLVPRAGSFAGRSRFAVPWGSYDEYEWASRETSDGYDIEVKYPWPTALTPLSAGSTVGFNLMVGVNDDASPTSQREFEYVLHMEPVTNSNCTSYDSPWCDNRVWCSPTLRD